LGRAGPEGPVRSAPSTASRTYLPRAGRRRSRCPRPLGSRAARRGSRRGAPGCRTGGPRESRGAAGGRRSGETGRLQRPGDSCPGRRRRRQRAGPGWGSDRAGLSGVGPKGAGLGQGCGGGKGGTAGRQGAERRGARGRPLAAVTAPAPAALASGSTRPPSPLSDAGSVNTTRLCKSPYMIVKIRNAALSGFCL
jgi:hypothetical protein